MRIRITRFRAGPDIDMTPDGEFVEPPRPRFADQVLRYAIVVAVLAAVVAVAALALWLAFILIPVAIVAAAVAYAAFRWRLWKLSRSVGPARPPYRP